MDLRIRWTEEAWIALNSIYAYHAIFSEQGARRLMKNILSAANRLSVFPLSGKIEPCLKYATRPYRSIVVKKDHKLIYRIEDNDTLIVIHDVWPCKRDFQNTSSTDRLSPL